MKITIDLPDFEAEDNMAVSQVFYSLGSMYENKDTDDISEPILLGTENNFIVVDDFDTKVKITLEK